MDEEPGIRRFPYKPAAVAERLVGMRCRFLPPVQIRNMIADHRLSIRIETDEHFTARVLADR